MLRHERRLLLDSLRFGLALTGLVVALDLAGFLTPAENFFYDLRARLCQHFSLPPTDKLVHVDIDDTALDVMGAFPWPRRKVAQIFDEIRLAGPKAVEADVLFDEPQELQYQPVHSAGGADETDATEPTTHPTIVPTSQPFERIDNDAELAAAMARLGSVIVPCSLDPMERPTPLYIAEVEELTKDLEQDETALAGRLRAQGIAVPPAGIGDQFYLARRDAIARRLEVMHVTADAPWTTIRVSLLPKTPVEIHPAVENVVREQWEKFLARQAYREHHSLPVPEGMLHLTNMELKLVPLRPQTLAAIGGAFVDYPTFGSAVIRSVPLLMEENGRVYPQMGLALACRMLDADMHNMRIESDTLVIPRLPGQPGHALRIPLAPARLSTQGHRMGNLMDIPWFGGATWQGMYDYPDHKREVQHIPLNEIWQACHARGKIVTNNQGMDDSIRALFQVMDPDHGQKRIGAYNENIPAPDDFSTREKTASAAIDEFGPFIDDGAKVSPEKRDEDTQRLVINGQALRNQLRLNRVLTKELAEFRRSLHKAMDGKAVLIGWTATAAIADFVPTSLHEKCPGMVVHGVIFSGIMTGEMWRRSPAWVAAAIAMALGALTALAVGYFSPMRALAIALGLVALYSIVNGELLFDYGNRIVGAAGPLTAIAVTWGACTLARTRHESRERTRITTRFGNYADSRLVDYVLENENVTFEGENREISVVFTDLAGFTSLSEKLGEKIVPVLNELLGELVPVIRDHHHGYVNKFLGDGIMFFYNAPMRKERHANAAVASVLDMQERLKHFNVRLRDRGLQELAMRAGIASGVVVVGDAGGGGRNDYTALGDAVNLSARLEPANKVVGTHTLMNARAAELLDGEFLIRPIGKIQVVGQENASMCYEPISRMSEATETQKELAAMTTMMVDAFITRRFEDCMQFIAQLEATAGVGKLTAVYREMCEEYLRQPPGETFDGRIVLKQK